MLTRLATREPLGGAIITDASLRSVRRETETSERTLFTWRTIEDSTTAATTATTRTGPTNRGAMSGTALTRTLEKVLNIMEAGAEVEEVGGGSNTAQNIVLVVQTLELDA